MPRVLGDATLRGGSAGEVWVWFFGPFWFSVVAHLLITVLTQTARGGGRGEGRARGSSPVVRSLAVKEALPVIVYASRRFSVLLALPLGLRFLLAVEPVSRESGVDVVSVDSEGLTPAEETTHTPRGRKSGQKATSEGSADWGGTPMELIL